jgi:hypothetical protein
MVALGLRLILLEPELLTLAVVVVVKMEKALAAERLREGVVWVVEVLVVMLSSPLLKMELLAQLILVVAAAVALKAAQAEQVVPVS